MLSKEAGSLIEEIKKAYMPVVDWTAMDFAQIRKEADAMATPGPFPEGVAWETVDIRGVRTEKTIVPDASGKVLLHIHGGGMIAGSAYADRFMVSQIASRMNCNAFSVDYRLSPEYAQPAAIEDCAAVYQGLLKQGILPADISLLGESAGGMLACSLCAYLKQKEIPLPGALCAISGSVDSRYQSQSMQTNRDSEIVVNQNLSEMMQAVYYKDADPLDPVLSPVHSDVTGWPPTYLMACRNEILRDESVRMCTKLQASDVHCELTIDEELFHTYMLFNLPESYEAFERIADFFRRYQ